MEYKTAAKLLKDALTYVSVKDDPVTTDVIKALIALTEGLTQDRARLDQVEYMLRALAQR